MSCCDAVRVVGAETIQPRRAGLFRRLFDHDDLPVYSNAQGEYLYWWQPCHTWQVGSDWQREFPHGLVCGACNQHNYGRPHASDQPSMPPLLTPDLHCPTDPGHEWAVFDGLRMQWRWGLVTVSCVPDSTRLHLPPPFRPPPLVMSPPPPHPAASPTGLPPPVAASSPPRMPPSWPPLPLPLARSPPPPLFGLLLASHAGTAPLVMMAALACVGLLGLCLLRSRQLQRSGHLQAWPRALSTRACDKGGSVRWRWRTSPHERKARIQQYAVLAASTAVNTGSASELACCSPA